MDDLTPDQEPQKRTGIDTLLRKVYRPGPLIALFTIAFLGLVWLGYSILTEVPPPLEPITAPVSAETPHIPQPKQFEEATSNMEDWVKQADLAIIETMRDQRLELNSLDLVDVELRKHENRNYHYQVLQLPQVEDRGRFLISLRQHLHDRLPKAVLLDNRISEALIEISGVPTHRLLLEAKPEPPAKSEDKKGPKIAVVIDDVGENMALLKGLLSLDMPLTFAVWPHASHTREAVKLILDKHHCLIEHFPMEPLGYPKVDPGDDALFVTMTPKEIRKRVEENLNRIPEAVGVNNHMGSKFTAYERGMTVALKEFKRHGLFFLDSLTSGKSVGRKVAKTTGITFHERDVFLDNVKDVNAILHQLKMTERVALKKGWAICIGHPYSATLAALNKWQQKRNTDISIVPLSSLAAE